MLRLRLLTDGKLVLKINSERSCKVTPIRGALKKQIRYGENFPYRCELCTYPFNLSIIQDAYFSLVR
jgi:hypothetical protein